MNHYAVILRKLRELNQLTIKQAAAQLGRSVGWLSEIENSKGAARFNSPFTKRLNSTYSWEFQQRVERIP